LQEDSFLEDNEDCWDQHILELSVPTKDFCKTPDINLRESRTAPAEPPPALDQRSADTLASAESKRVGCEESVAADRAQQSAAPPLTESGGGQRKCCESARAANKANVLCAVCSAEFCDAECFLLHSQFCKGIERAIYNDW
jgi:hypothetical protein